MRVRGPFLRPRLALVGAIALLGAVIAAGPEPADAGGSTWSFEPAVLEQGQPARAWAQVAWAHNPSLGTPTDGPWYA